MKINSTKTALYLTGALVAMAAFPGFAFAQAAAEEDEDDDQIVVTGTLIRGIEVPAAQTISLNAEDIAEVGASTTNELLASLPQVAGFNGRFDSDPRAADRQQVSRPNLRNLPGVSAATGATTLLLVDGHRMTPMGVDQASFDADFIAPGALQGIEVMTDGGSSLYGADAVGGVINFITRKSFDGIQVDGGYDLGDAYGAWTLGATAGTSWNNGGAFLSVNTYQRDDLLRSDRDWAAQGQWNAAGTVLSPSGSTCPTPVGVISTWRFVSSFNVWTDNERAGSTRTNVGTPCDLDAQGSMLPELERYSAFFGLNHDFSDTLSLSVKANYGESAVTYSRAAQGDSITERTPTISTSPTAAQVTVPGSLGSYDVASVSFSYGPNSGYTHRDQTLDLQVYGITPELTAQLGGDWQAKVTGYYGESDSSRLLPSSNRIKLAAAIAAGTVNIRNIAAASPTVIADITNFEVAGDAQQSLLLGRVIMDGPLFDLPAGPIRAAVGLEYNRDQASSRSASVVGGGLSAVPTNSASRNVKSVFGELNVPVYAALDLSLSGRYDDYSDFGSTFNPSIGLNFTPFEQLRLFGRWSESFNAPTALDSTRTANARFIADASAGVPDPLGQRTATPTRNDVLLVEGNGGPLSPQTAETWSGGFEFNPVDNLTIGATYYDIDFQNLLSAVNPQLASVVLLNPEKFISNPTQAQFNAFLAASSNGAQFANINANDVGVIIDRRIANLDAARLKGLDFHANINFEVGEGELDFGVTGNKQLSFFLTSSGTTVDQLRFDVPDYSLAAHVGYRAGGFRSRLTMNHSGGFDTNIAVAQTEVQGFTMLDLALAYEFAEDAGAMDGLTLRLNVDNLLDTEPPVYRQQRNLNYSGFTLGRIFKFAVSKRF